MEEENINNKVQHNLFFKEDSKQIPYSFHFIFYEELEKVNVIKGLSKTASNFILSLVN